MKKILKLIAMILVILLVAGMIGFFCLVMFVSPNRFKPLIVEQVKKSTGREIVMDGDLSWTLYPALGVKAGHLELKNPPEFKEKIFAEIQSATISVRLMPLFRSRVESNGIILKGLTLNLIKNSNGKTSWDFSSTTTSSSINTSNNSSSSSRAAAFGLAVSAIDVSNATIHWINEQQKQAITVDHFDLNAKNINLTKPFPVKSSFNFTNLNQNTSGQIDLNSKIALNAEKQTLFLDDFNIHAKIQKEGKKFDFNAQGDVVGDLANKKLQVDNLLAQMANLKLAGKININNFTDKLNLSGQARIHPVDLKAWLQNIGQDVPAIEVCKNLTGFVQFTAGNSLESLDLKGNVKVNEIKASNLQLKEPGMQMQMQKGVLILSSITAGMYEGRLDGQVKIDLTPAVPQISLQGSLTNVQAEPLLNDLSKNQKLKIAGVGNLELNLTTSGKTKEAISNALGGTIKLTFNQGVLKGIDIGYLVDSAIALANKQPMPTTNTDQTEFGTLTATATVNKGLISNKDLYLNSPRFDTKGEGEINIVNQQINYHLQTVVKQAAGSDKNNLANLYGYPIPILIKGDLSNPAIRLDMEALMKAIANQHLQKAKIQIQEKIKEKIPGKAGEFLNNLLGN